MQTPSAKTVALIALIASIASIAFGALGASAVSNALKPPTPPLIATVSLDVLLNGLHEKYYREEEINVRKTQFNDMIKQKKTSFDDEKKRLEQASPAEQPAIRERLNRLAFDADNDLKFAEQVLDGAHAEALAGIYDKMVDAAIQLAKKNGYNMVIADDQTAKIVLPASALDVHRSIALKRMLYSDPAHDITQELITSMNNAWIAGGGKPAPTPAPAPPPANGNPIKPGGG
jgi:Skp family chaperone for outer membrane proteins